MIEGNCSPGTSSPNFYGVGEIDVYEGFRLCEDFRFGYAGAGNAESSEPHGIFTAGDERQRGEREYAAGRG
jgi:hypothetical protein